MGGMRFVSCVAVSSTAGEEAQGDVVLCECDLSERQLPENAEEVGGLVLEDVVISEGNEIHRRRKVSGRDLKLFTGKEQEREALRGAVWYELVKLLSGHRVQLESLTGKVQFTKWVCHVSEGESWFLVMELEAAGIVRKVAQLEVQAVSEGEADLFQMTSRLFASYCEANDTVRALTVRTNELESLLKQADGLERVRHERDDKTRSIMVGLLNEKKTRIAQLELQLEKKQLSPALSDISDSEVINKNVTEAVTELISPGKRRARTQQMNDEQRLKKVAKKLIPETKEEPIDDFDEDFQFFGISKTQETAPNSRGSPKKPTIKQEPSDDKLHESDSQNCRSIIDSRSTIGAQSESDTDADTETESPHATEQDAANSAHMQSASESDTDISLST